MARKRIRSTEKQPRVFEAGDFTSERGSRLGAVRRSGEPVTPASSQSSQASSAQPAASQAATAGGGGSGFLPLVSGGGNTTAEYLLAKRDLSLPASRVVANSDTIEASTRDPKRLYLSVRDESIDEAQLADGAVTLAKMASMTAGRLLGRRSGSSGAPELITPGAGLSISTGALLNAAVTGIAINGASTSDIDLSDSSPAAAAGRKNVAWATTGVGPTSVSGSVIQGPTLFKVLDAGAAGTTGSTAAQPWFPTAGAVTVTANRAYRFCGLIAVTRDNTGALSIGFGGTATVSSILAYSVGQSASANTNGTAQTSSWRNSTALVTAAPSANVSWAWIEGVMRIGAGGTIIPQFSTSISAISTITVERNTFFEMTEIGSDTVTERGTWS